MLCEYYNRHKPQSPPSQGLWKTSCVLHITYLLDVGTMYTQTLCLLHTKIWGTRATFCFIIKWEEVASIFFTYSITKIGFHISFNEKSSWFSSHPLYYKVYTRYYIVYWVRIPYTYTPMMIVNVYSLAVFVLFTACLFQTNVDITQTGNVCKCFIIHWLRP